MATTPEKTLWTIGHSTHSIETFIAMLQAFQIEVVADIRRLPGSRKYPQYNQEELELTLSHYNIRYVYIPELAGRRKVNPNSQNTAWRNRSFQGYADYMETSEFMHGVKTLMDIASEFRTVIMCAEAVWWRCHRSMVADYFKSVGWTVIHIINEKQSKIHPYTGAANLKDGKLTYHPIDSEN